jgi:heme exporter protein B
MKDVTCELRSRRALNAVMLFAVTSLTAVVFCVDRGWPDYVAAALLWLVIYFSAVSGLSGSFAHEEDSRTADALRLAALPEAVCAGKVLFNLALLLCVVIVLALLGIVMLGIDIANWGRFAVVLLAGSVGLASSSALLGAMVSKSGVRTLLFPIIAFPISLPLLIAAIKAVESALGSGGVVENYAAVRVLISYSGILLVLSLVFFRFVWE